jgi:hypothetical protein
MMLGLSVDDEVDHVQARVVVQTRRDAGPSVAVRLALAGLKYM